MEIECVIPIILVFRRGLYLTHDDVDVGVTWEHRVPVFRSPGLDSLDGHQAVGPQKVCPE